MEFLQQQRFSRRAIALAGVVSVLAGVFWAYGPSLSHAPKHDQIAYLANAAGQKDLPSLLAGTYNLNRKSLVDPHLFRPLLYGVLGIEFWIFRYDFELWRVTAILLHLFVVSALFWLLLSLAPRPIAFWSAAFFSLMLTNVPMVNWEHINAYMIFASLLLLTLRGIFLYVQSAGLETRHLPAAAFFLLCAAFIFEAGALFSFLLSLFFFGLSFRAKAFRKAAVWFLAPFVLYFLASAVDLFLSGSSLTPESGKILQGVLSGGSVLYALQCVKWFLFAGIFASPADMAETTRTGLLAHTLDWAWPFQRWMPHLAGGFALLVLAIWALITGWSRDLWQRRCVFLLALTGLSAGYVLLIALGRVNTRGVIVGLLFNAYYFYIFWILLIVFFVSAIDWGRIRERLSSRILRGAAVFFLAGIISVNMVSIHQVNASVADQHQDVRHLIRIIDGFIAQHKHEPDLSFYMGPEACPGNVIGEWMQHRGAPSGGQYTIAQVLYPRYFRAQQPKYRIGCHE